MTDATFMYGIGATKAGTSWLFRYLSEHPECAVPDPKELHFFNAREFGVKPWQIQGLSKRIDRLEREAFETENDLKSVELLSRRDGLLRWREILLNGSEADYQAFLSDCAGPAKLVADITPAYAMLSEQSFRQMAKLAPVTRFVYVLRDPVERLWSNIRMAAVRKARTPERLKHVAHRMARHALSGEDNEQVKRSDYKSALERLERAVDRNSLFVGVFEDFFTPETLKKLCTFLGISYRPGQFGRLVHSGVDVPLNNELREQMAHMLAPQYAAAEDWFGTIPAAWQKNMEKT